MDALSFKPIVFVRSLKTLGEAIFFLGINWRRLLPVVAMVFLLNLALTELMVNLASPHVNLDFMRPFFELDNNSTTPAADAMVVVFPDASKEDSASWRLISFLGSVFQMLSTIVAILLFSKACSYNNLQEGHNPASLPFSSTWSEWKRLLLFSLNGANMVILTSILLEAVDLDDELSDYLENFLGFMYMLTAVVSSKEGLYGFSAAEKAWALVGEKFYEITVLGAASYFLRELVEDYYMSEVHIPRMGEVAAHVIREDTAAEIFRFSVISALLTVILQTFQCSVILAFYSSDDAGRPTDRQRDLNDATAMIAATNAQPLPEAEPVRRSPAASGRSDASSSDGASGRSDASSSNGASGRSDASSSNGGRVLNLDRRTPRPRRQTRPHPKYDPRVWQL